VAKEKRSDEPMKVTDKRIFTADGELREEFRESVTPEQPAASESALPQPARPAAAPPPPQPTPGAPETTSEPRRRPRGEMPDTPFAMLVQTLGVNAYMSLGMTQQGAKGPVDLPGARQMIEILTMLQEKTKGNLTEDEQDFLATFVGELKLAFVRMKGSL